MVRKIYRLAQPCRKLTARGNKSIIHFSGHYTKHIYWQNSATGLSESSLPKSSVINMKSCLMNIKQNKIHLSQLIPIWSQIYCATLCVFRE